jgi:hypothetical protein
VKEIKKDTFGVASDGTLVTPSFGKTGQLAQKLTETDRRLFNSDINC